MSSGVKKLLKIVLPIALGLFLVGYTYQMTTPEDRVKIVDTIKNANLFWVLLSVVVGILSHISRAIRWNYLLEPMGYKPKLSNNVLIVLIAYFANLGIPRSGEILRATALATYEKVPFEKGFGTIVTERIVDLLMLILVILIALATQTKLILGYLEESGSALSISAGVLLAGILGLFVLRAFLKRSSSSLALKVKDFLKGLLEGILSVFNMKQKWAFIAHSIFIWAAYVGMFFVIKFAIPGTESLSFGALLTAFVAGAFAMMATPGGLGLYPIAVSGALVFFGASETSGDAFGWIIWIAQTLLVVIFGAISFLLLPLFNRNK